MANREGLLGKKIGMTRVFDDKGRVVPVTVIEVGPCRVTQIKTAARDGYNAVQLGLGLAKRVNKAMKGHLGDVPAPKYMRELRTDNVADFQIGQVLSAGVFKIGELVDVIGVSKGRGFAGVVKRHNFAGGPKTRGQSDRQRKHGSIGSSNTPGWVAKGMPMEGHMGDDRVTVQNLRVVMVDEERNLLALRGGVPGAVHALLFVRKAIKQ
jgi:large subunit ribosomal protein L3